MLDASFVRASDLMERHVVTVTPDTPVLGLHRLFVDRELHGAPVVSEDGTVQGVVSTLDLLRVVRGELERGERVITSYFRDELPYSGSDWLRMPESFQDRMQDLTAADAMSREIVMVRPDANVDEIVKTLSRHRVHRVLVGDNRVLQGVITVFDLLPVLSGITRSHVGRLRYTGYCRGALSPRLPA